MLGVQLNFRTSEIPSTFVHSRGDIYILLNSRKKHYKLLCYRVESFREPPVFETLQSLNSELKHINLLIFGCDQKESA